METGRCSQGTFRARQLAMCPRRKGHQTGLHNGDSHLMKQARARRGGALGPLSRLPYSAPTMATSTRSSPRSTTCLRRSPPVPSLFRQTPISTTKRCEPMSSEVQFSAIVAGPLTGTNSSSCTTTSDLLGSPRGRVRRTPSVRKIPELRVRDGINYCRRGLVFAGTTVRVCDVGADDPRACLRSPAGKLARYQAMSRSGAGTAGCGAPSRWVGWWLGGVAPLTSGSARWPRAGSRRKGH
jgi:hypothetical protein